MPINELRLEAMKSQDQLKQLIQDSMQGLNESRKRLEEAGDGASPEIINGILQVVPRFLLAYSACFLHTGSG